MKFEGKERDEYVKRLSEMVAGRCRTQHITHPVDIANEFATVAEIVGEWEASA